MAKEASNAAPWHAAFPEPSGKDVQGISRASLLAMLRDGKVPRKDFLLVDLRRNDHEGGTIRGSLNLPAQSLFYSLDVVYNLCEAAGIKQVVWYCGSSQGRGTRAAAWFQDHVASRGKGGIESVILKGGIKGWATGGSGYIELMDGYDAAVWEKARTD